MILGKHLQSKLGYKEEIFDFFKMCYQNVEILDCNICKIQPEIFTIRNYLDAGMTHLIGVKIKCPKCDTFIKTNHSSHLSDCTETTTAKEILNLWNLKMKGDNSPNNRWFI